VKFQIQLLSGKTVVLVECPGYESELFMPQIVNSRITFQNIIPDRRCCPEINQLSETSIQLGGTAIRAASRTPFRYSPVFKHAAPLAKSTPASGLSRRQRSGQENSPSPQRTPEQMRCRPTRMTSLGEVEMELATNRESPLRKMATSVSHRQSPEPPLLPISQNANVSPKRTYPPPSSKPQPVLCNFMHKAPPLRTYSRRMVGTPGKSKSSTAWLPLQKRKKSSAVSSTKAPNPTMKLEVRNRKLIVDAKKTLAAHDPKISPTPISKKRIIRKQVTGKTRKQYEALKVTAFDLLTNPAMGHVSVDLGKLFKVACMDKRTTTLPNYAQLAAAAPLKVDRQVKALLSKQKQMER
ncbi:hypothetical protein KR009_003423, partial [Drosophila setifemur]